MNRNDSCDPINPMAQMLKQFGQDHSLQRNRFEGSSQSMASPSMRTQTQGPFVQHGERMKNEFFGQEHHHPPQLSDSIRMGNNFRYSDLQRELDNVHQTNRRGGWADEFGKGYQSNPISRKLTAREAAAADLHQNDSVWRDEFFNHSEKVDMSSDRISEFKDFSRRHYDWTNEFNIQAREKEPLLLHNNAAWEEQFASFDDNKDDIKQEITRKKEETITGDQNTKDYENAWQNIQTQPAEQNNWEDEFGTFSNLGIVHKPELGEYVFEISNPFLSHPDPILEGLRLMEEGRSLTDAALAFEAAVQKDPENSQAWMNLGNIQAQNEKEIPAARALEKATKINPGNLDALMSLSVSYTNEAYDQAANQTLEHWIVQKYPSVLNGQALSEEVTPFELQNRVTNLFLTVAKQAPDSESMDPDVQIGLGILFYGSGDLDKAVDCFISALKSRPNDYLLWNRMGATLANNGRAEEAIDAYHEALEIRPTFVRARYNLGVSCINIGCYKEAVEHILTGISLQKRGISSGGEGINISNNSWNMLRKAFILMHRHDLAEKAVAGADLNQFRPEFEF